MAAPADLHRPTYHLMPPGGWMNDPNGPIYYNGSYHLFYQHNPGGDGWGNIHWAHARSADLIHWEHLPLALAPSPEWNEIHCFSGCAVLDGGVPSLVYTSICGENGSQRLRATQRLAKSRDGMRTWQKAARPLLEQDIHDAGRVMEWRDPFIWRENDCWNMIIGGALDGYGAIFLYRSADLASWTYVGPMLVKEDAPFLECPNLLRFGEKSVLLYSPHGAVVYHIGTILPDGSFATESTGILDPSGRQGFYAPNTLLNDPKGRYLTWGWVTEEARGGYRIDGYNGAFSLPRELSLADGKTLVQRPAAELEALRARREEVPAFCLRGASREIPVRGKALELHLEAALQKGDDFVLNLFQTDDGLEKTRLRYVADTGILTLERSRSSLHNEPHKTFQSAYIPPCRDALDLTVYLDHSIIEVFANDAAVITGRVYPTREDADGISVEGTVGRLSMDIWEMQPLVTLETDQRSKPA